MSEEWHIVYGAWKSRGRRNLRVIRGYSTRRLAERVAQACFSNGYDQYRIVCSADAKIIADVNSCLSPYLPPLPLPPNHLSALILEAIAEVQCVYTPDPEDPIG